MHKEPHPINLTRMWRAFDKSSVEWPAIPSHADLRRSNPWVDLTQFAAMPSDRPIHLIRNFNRPGGLNADSRCDLVFENLPAETICEFNGKWLGMINGPLCRFDISQYLQANNRIRIETPSSAGLLTDSKASVRLEIFD